MKRTQRQIEKDFLRIRKVAESIDVISINDIAKATNLSMSEVYTSLARHPRIKEKIMLELVEKRKNSGDQIDTDTKYSESFDKPESLEISETASIYDEVFVIDASITGIENLCDTLSEIAKTNTKFILTSITIKELDKMQKFKDLQADDARHILAMAAENPESFYSVLIDETFETPDDCIIHYCATNPGATLLTSDKSMALKARMYGVKTHYFKQHQRYSDNSQQSCSHDKAMTLFAARKEGDKLLISDFTTANSSILVISQGIEYTKGEYELKIGDEIYIANKKTDYMTFAHYQITTLSAKNNCSLIYSKRFYNVSDNFSSLPKAGYKSFMRDFNRRYSL